MNNDARYTSYQNMVTQVNTGLVQMQKVAVAMKLEETGKKLEESRKKLESRNFSVGILGEFKRGKSSFINALLGREILPVDALPTTATLNRITYGALPRAYLRYKDEKVEEVEIGELSRYVTKLTQESEDAASRIEEAVVEYPSWLR